MLEYHSYINLLKKFDYLTVFVLSKILKNVSNPFLKKCMLPKLSLYQICLKLAKWRLKFVNVCPLSLFQAHREAALQNHKYV